MEALEKLIETKFEVVNTKLDGINNHLTRQNGTLLKHDKQINEALEWRAKKYQQIDDKFKDYDACMQDVKGLMSDSIGSKAMKKYQAKLFLLSTTVITIIIAVIGLWLHATLG